MDQELPPELDENTPVVWPTDPEEETNNNGMTDNDTNDEDKAGTSDSTAASYSYWFGGEVGTASQNDSLSEDDEEEEEEMDAEQQKPQRSRHKKDEDDDPDWTEENDGIVLPKKRVKLKREEDSVTKTPSSAGSGAGSAESKQYLRFRFSWTEDFKWLKYDAWSKEMFCRICQQAGQVGEFATEGSRHFDKTSLHMHNVSKDHVEAEFIVKRLAANKSKNGAIPSLEPTPHIDDDDDDDVESQNMLYSETALIIALRTAFYAAQNACDKTPTQVYQSMMALQDACNDLGAKELRLGKQPNHTLILREPSASDEKAEYAFGDDESLADMHDVLARIVQEDLYNKISHCDYIGIIIQEYPDADLQPLQMQLVIHARYTHKGHVYAGFLATIIVSEDKPDEAVKEVLRVLQECDILMQKVVAVQIQCPKKNGKLVTSSGIHHWQMAKSFADISANMIVLVSAQRHPTWNTCLSLATQKLEEGTKYQHLLGRLVTYLQSISPKLQAVEPLKQLVNDPLCQWDGLQMPPWIMVQKTAKVVCSTWPTLIEVLETEATAQKDTQAQQLKDELQKYQFLAFVHLLLDCLPILNDLEIQLNCKSPKEACQHLTECLNNVLEHPGDNERRLTEGVDVEKKTFCNHSINISEQQQERSNQMREDLIQSICMEIDTRCNVLEKAVMLRGSFKSLDPMVLASKKESELGEFGRKDLQELTAAFLDVSSEKDLFPEYQEMKMILFTHHKNDSLKAVSEKINPGKIQKQVPMTPKGVERCPNMIRLLRCAVTIPGVCRKADEEVRQMLRQSQEFMEKHGTEATTLSRMMIANHGVKISAFDFIAALQEWNSL
ncbi:uncharacterized protein [Amphiura filiformis]|uniref:uncharacterized protein n=1 Tax=Amphiura filiformis TaxID=82378 RepID=UPI003B224451